MEFVRQLTVVATQGEADIICSLLRAHGIRYSERSTMGFAPELVGVAGVPREILVAEEQLEAARELLATEQGTE
jgi:hypothetical protein